GSGDAVVSGGRVMAPPTAPRPALPRCRWWCLAAAIVAVVAIVSSARPSYAQSTGNPIINFPARPKAPTQPGQGLQQGGLKNPNVKTTKEQMLVRAGEIHDDYTNERVSAVGNVQIYYAGSTLEADKVIYDQRTKRLHAEGNVRLSEPDGKVLYGEILDLSDDFRDGFVDSLKLDGPEQTRFAATRGE